MEKRTARFTILIDPRKKEIFEQVCAKQDITPSQVVRKLIRQYIIDNVPEQDLPSWLKTSGTADTAAARARRR
jgi:antitoxin component of RelBE/YafQ-DinJ toxin-antitoxin module